MRNARKKCREYVELSGIRHFYDAGAGICNQLLSEKGHALPGRLIVGGDSHTGTSGAMGAAACGIGVSEVAYVMVKGSLWFQVPETIRFVLKGNATQGGFLEGYSSQHCGEIRRGGGAIQGH